MQGLRGLEPIPLFKAWIMQTSGCSFISSHLTHTFKDVTDQGTSSHYRTGPPLRSRRRGSPVFQCPRTSWSDAANQNHMSCCRDSSDSSCPSYLHLQEEPHQRRLGIVEVVLEWKSAASIRWKGNGSRWIVNWVSTLRQQCLNFLYILLWYPYEVNTSPLWGPDSLKHFVMQGPGPIRLTNKTRFQPTKC